MFQQQANRDRSSVSSVGRQHLGIGSLSTSTDSGSASGKSDARPWTRSALMNRPNDRSQGMGDRRDGQALILGGLVPILIDMSGRKSNQE